MLNDNYTKDLLGLKDVIVTNVEEFNFEKHIYLTLRVKATPCPICGVLTTSIHDYREQRVKDISSFGLKTILHIRKRRYICNLCDKRFFEENTFLPKYQRTTNRLWANIINSLSDVKSMKQIGKENNVSGTTVARVLDKISYGLPKLPEVIGIDEFKGNSGGEKFNCILTDPKGHNILDILPKRKAESLYGYFMQFSNRFSVKFVTMDMSNLFRNVVREAFPNATIIADKYHVVRQVTWAFENVRKRIQKELYKNSRIRLKHSRKLLLKRQNQLTTDEMYDVARLLDYSKDLGAAYYLKERFYEVMESENEYEARIKLSNWFMHAEIANLKEFKDAVNSYHNWEKEILNIFKYKLTNGFTEGCNNLIKVIKRTGYGLRNFERFRNRILYISNSPC